MHHTCRIRTTNACPSLDQTSRWNRRWYCIYIIPLNSPACLCLMCRRWDESEWNRITHLRHEKSAPPCKLWQICFLTNDSANTRLGYTGSRHRRHLALKCHMHHVGLHAYMHAGEQVGSARGIPPSYVPVIRATQSNSPSNLSKIEKQNKLILAQLRDFWTRADAVICIMPAHTFCTLISIFTISGDCVYPARCAIWISMNAHKTLLLFQ